MRKLASIQKVAEIKPIENADAIEHVRINGWWVVCKRDEFHINDTVIYIETDAWLPEDVAPFLSKGREFNGVKGERLRTIKLRGAISQGLVLPNTVEGCEGDDVTEILGIQKWERPIPACLQGQMKGNFPAWIRKTDQDRIQNRMEVFDDFDARYEVTLKLDGSSMTAWFKDSERGVCSRNIDLKTDQEGNTFVDMFHKLFGGFITTENIAIQGELMGERIQGNREKLAQHEFYIFGIWDINTQTYWSPKKVRDFCADFDYNHVPVIHEDVSLTEIGLTNIEKALAYSDRPSMNHKIAEGLVYKRVDGSDSFKVINNKFLLKEE